MASLGMTFDPTEVEPDSGRAAPFPEGRYVLQVIESDVKDNKSGTGKILALTLEVFEGPFEKRKMFENLNIVNASPQAQEIAQRQLSALTHAMGEASAITDSEELHFKPFEAEVGIEPAGTDPKTGKNFPAKNKIVRYVFDGAAEAPALKPASKAAAAPAKASGSRPWERNRTAA
jgi:hypothetical protein